MTEDEAKTKWCPHAVASHTNPRGLTNWDADGNEIPAPRFQHNCIASACMAWRWGDNKYEAFFRSKSTRAERPCNPGDTFNPNVEEVVERYTAEGFCGLARRP
jgi:hypothetical protein